MFDIGFAELLLVVVVTLIVVGPDQLPSTIRTASLWIGRIRRGFQTIKADVEREIGADEIRQQLHNESVLKSLNAGKKELEEFKQRMQEGINPQTINPPSAKADRPSGTDPQADQQA